MNLLTNNLPDRKFNETWCAHIQLKALNPNRTTSAKKNVLKLKYALMKYLKNFYFVYINVEINEKQRN